MAAYTITQAIAALRKRHPWSTQSVQREYLEGLVDGANKIFHLANPPAQTSSVTVYDKNGATVAPSSIDVDSGLLIFTAAPTDAYTATYTHVGWSDTQMTGICEEGFSLMESLLSRSYYLYSGAVSSSSSSSVDPVIGSSTFSQLPIQVKFFLDCCDYVWLEAMAREGAYHAMSVREERSGGLQIDRSKQATAYDVALQRAKDSLLDMAAIAAEEAGLSSTLIEGQGVPGATSDYRHEVMNWWDDSLQDLGMIP